jgi:hypothetical protein
MSRLTADVAHIADVRPNAWNPNRMNAEMYRKELASLRKFGYINPIIVREVGNKYEIIDGEHRWRALNELGYDLIEVTVIEGLNDEEAKQLTIVLNETRGRADPQKLGVLLADLLDSIPKSDLLDVLPLSPVDFDRIVGLEGFDWGSLSSEPVGSEPKTWVERTYRLPKEAAAVIDEALINAKDGDEGIADWQALEAIAADFLAGTSAMPSPRPMAPASTAGSR